jgi:hypothetical protein
MSDEKYGLMLRLLQNACRVVGDLPKREVTPDLEIRLIPRMIEQYKLALEIPGAHKDDKLLEISRHTCTRAWFQKGLIELENKIAANLRKGYTQEEAEQAQTEYSSTQQRNQVRICSYRPTGQRSPGQYGRAC